MDRTFAWIYKAIDHPKERRFSSTRSTDNSDHLPSGDAQLNRIDRCVVSKTACDLREFEHK